uniref:Uncharacterized protein n=1 Tax=Panagrolaimus sp. ES5 TaxID=591445 RepID=A0AC34F318_9BILA
MDDPSEANAQIPECKECRMNSSEALVGTWHVVLWSHNFLITVISDLNMQIDKLAANQPLSDQKSLFEWFADPPGVICPQLVVLSPAEATKFEFAYTIDPGLKPKSIINKWDRQFDGSILWHLTPKLQVHICPTFIEKDIIILRQIDSFPRCNNLIVLVRGDKKNFDKIDAIRDMIEEEGHTSIGTNALVRTRCIFS